MRFLEALDLRRIVRAELIGSTTCTAAGISVTNGTPVLSLCRRLFEAGHDPATRLEVYRGTVLALTVRSIGEAAQLTIKTAGNGNPVFAKEPQAEGVTASPMRKFGSALPRAGLAVRPRPAGGAP